MKTPSVVKSEQQKVLVRALIRSTWNRQPTSDLPHPRQIAVGTGASWNSEVTINCSFSMVLHSARIFQMRCERQIHISFRVHDFSAINRKIIHRKHYTTRKRKRETTSIWCYQTSTTIIAELFHCAIVTMTEKMALGLGIQLIKRYKK